MNNLTLWLACGLLSLLAMAFVVVPLLRQRVRAGVDGIEQRRLKNREVYGQRLRELDAERDAGLVTPEDEARVRAELQRAFLRDMEALEAVSAPPAGEGGSSSRMLPLAFAVLVPILALVLYRSWGAHEDLGLPALFQAITSAQSAEQQVELLNELAVTLQSRLEREPEDMRSAYMLGTLYEELGQYDAALATFDHMLQHMEPGRDMATVLGQMARTRFTQNEGVIDSAVREYMDRALALNPNEYHSTGILAQEAFAQEDLVAALGYWRRQLSSAQPGSRDAAALREIITLVETYLPDDEAPVAAGEGASITITVDIDPALRGRLAGKQSLFVYVRNPEMRPPLVAQNLPLGEFPLTLTLDNSMSMLGMTLESAPTLIVGARLSASGSAIAESGDFETVTEPFELQSLDGPLNLVIDTVVP